MKTLPAAKIRKAKKINSYLEEKAPSVDLRDRSRLAPILKLEIAIWNVVDGDEETNENEVGEYQSEECDFQDECEDEASVKFVDFLELSDGSGHWLSLLIPKDLLGMSWVVYRPECVEIRRHWTKETSLELTAVFDWNDPKLLSKVLVAATEDICADWESAF